MYSTKHSGSHVASTPLILTAVTIRTTTTRARSSTTIATSFLALAQNHKVPILSQGQPSKVEWCLPRYSAVHNSKAPSSPVPSHPEILDSILHRKSSPMEAQAPEVCMPRQCHLECRTSHHLVAKPIRCPFSVWARRVRSMVIRLQSPWFKSRPNTNALCGHGNFLPLPGP